MATKQTPSNTSRASAKASSLNSAQHNLTDVASVREFLQARINPPVAASLDASIGLAWPMPEAPASTASAKQQTALSEAPIEGQAELNFSLKQGQFSWLEQGAQTQATFWFRDAHDVAHLLSSSDEAYADFMHRFMAGQLSSDGYLPWAFTLLSLFRGGPSLATPD